MYPQLAQDLNRLFDELRSQGLFKKERIITSPQDAKISIVTGEEVLNFCANNYLGLANDPQVIEAAAQTMRTWGFGLSSVRFICGTQQIHKELEARLSAFLGTDDTILYAACFDANGGVFEPLLDENCAIISDALNHASIIDGIRLCKAARFVYQHADMQSLEENLEKAAQARIKLVVTDGIFSMDGDMAPLPEIVRLARKHNALVMVDDSHASGYIGPTGRGTAEYYNLQGEIDLITTTFGKALGGASGGCTSGRAALIELLRQRSRPYLFSNTLAPAVVGATLKVLDLLEQSNHRCARVIDNARRFRLQMEAAGFDLVKGNTAIVPVMLYDARLATAMADRLLAEGIYVIGFVYPVVPKDRARIRVQLSAAHQPQDIDRAVEAFVKTGKELGVI